MIRNLFGRDSKCRTIDKVDIFGDSSGVALYQLDGNANDTGGNFHGTETAITYGGGVYERGAYFAGGTGTNFIELTNNLNATRTISAWVYVTGTSVNQRVIACNDGGGSNGNGIRLNIINGSLTCAFQTANNGVYTTLNSTATLTANAWNHVVGTTNDGGLNKLYINGGTPATMATATVGASIRSVTIGCYKDNTYPNGIYTMLGSMDQLRFFNRAITATEVATLYAECAPTSTVDDINPFMDGSLKALYQFNSDATDATGVYNGTATNVTYGTGKFGNCAVFNGSALISTSFALSANIFSYSIWANVTTVSSTIQSLIDFTTNRAMLSSGNGTNSYVSYYDGGTYRTFGTYALPSNTRVFLTLVVNGTTAYLYADGVLKGSSACTAVIPSGGMYLGRYAGSASGFLTGNLDQARLFNNKALTPLEVASLYNETTPLEEPMYKLVDPFRDGSGKALYRLDGNALDESGNYNGTATSVTYGAGQFGRCGVFNGSTSKIGIGNPIQTNGSFSVSFLAKRTTAAQVYAILARSAFTVGVNTQYGFLIQLDSVGFNLYRQVGDTVNNMASATVSTDTSWNFYTATYNVINGETKLYFNGALSSTTTLSTSPISYYATNDAGFYEVGVHNYVAGAQYYMNGSIDQVRIFNRALTAGEVSKLYTGENNVL